MGRSGSTLCFSTLQKAARTILNRNPARFEPSLSRATLGRGTIVKTHDYPDALNARRKPVKVLFIFGSTYEASLSVNSCESRFGADWVAEHFRNCKSPYGIDDLFEFDALGMAQQVREWSVFDHVPVLCVRFDALWEHARTIASFTGYPFDPPKKQPRVTHSISDYQRQCAKAVYDPLDNEINKLPKLFVAAPEMGSFLERLPDNPDFSKAARARRV